MHTHEPLPGTIRKLWPTEKQKFRDHLLRLDQDARHARFAHGVSDGFITDYAESMGEMGGVVFGYFEDAEVHATAELKKLGDIWGHAAEAAFSVERPFQEHGVGTELMGRVILAARNRGVSKLYMSCLAQNTKMRHIAAKYDADLKFEYGEVIGEILPADPNYFSIFAEAAEDRAGFLMAVLNVQKRMSRAA